MIVVLCGAPGAGKGTQADLLSERNAGFKKVSTGDALRNQTKIGSEIGKRAESFMKEGKLVPDELLLSILTAELEASRDKVVLLDGYPRNVAQAATLVSLVPAHPVKACLHLDVGRQELVARLSGRRVCSGCGASYHVSFNPPTARGMCAKCGAPVVQRPDDGEAKVLVRLEIYDRETKPVLDFYRQAGIYVAVNGEGDTESIYEKLRMGIKTAIGA